MATRRIGVYGRHARSTQKVAKIRGERVVQHLAGREEAGDGVVSALVAVPMFAGENIRQLELFTAAITDQEEQPDSLMRTDVVVALMPWPWRVTQFGASSAGIESLLAEQWRDVGTNYDPNPSAQDVPDTTGFLLSGGSQLQVLYSREEVLWPITNFRYQSVFTGGSEVTVSRAHHGFRRSATLKMTRPLSTDSVLVCFMARDSHDAQTDFGIIDTSALAVDSYQEVLGGTEFDELSGTGTQKLYEQLYAGDTVIEADTWKDTQLRQYVTLRARIGTPYPHHRT